MALHRLVGGEPLEAHLPLSPGQNILHHDLHPGGHPDPATGPEGAPRPSEGDPAPRGDGRMDQQHLGCAPSGPGAEKAGRPHPRHVAHQQVAGGGKGDDVRENPVLQPGESGTIPVHHEQPGGIPALGRKLGDQVRGEQVVEIRGPHGREKVSRQRSRPARRNRPAG